VQHHLRIKIEKRIYEIQQNPDDEEQAARILILRLMLLSQDNKEENINEIPEQSRKDQSQKQSLQRALNS